MEVPLLIVGFLVLLLVGFPIGFAMMIAALGYVVAEDLPLISLIERYVGSFDSFALLAIPFYLLAANVMNHIGVTERIFNFALSIMGHVRGALGHVNVLASMIFAGMSGSNSADAAGLGTIETKVMLDEGYDRSFTAAVTAASSIVGPIIPPSISFVVWGVIAEVSVARMFAAGIVPGILLGLSMMALIWFMDRFGWITCPRRPRAGWRAVAKAAADGFLSLITPIIIIGGILSGVVTPTEAGVIAVVYALGLGVHYRRLTLGNFIKAMDDTIAATAFILLMLAGAHTFGWVITLEKLPEAFTAWMLTVFADKYVILLVVNIGLLIMGMFIEGLAGVILVAPTMIALATALEIDLVHLGVFLIINMLIGLLTPPVAPILYITGAIARAPMAGLVKAIIPFLIPLVGTLMLLTYVPELTLALPDLIWGK